jgi:putative SOS response-associated peptidase YedK
MCNLYHLAPREHVQAYFRAAVPDYPALPVGPFGTGLFLRPGDEGGQGLQGLMGQWGMIQPRARSRRPASRAILTNNARAETVAARPTYRDAWAAGQRCLVPAAWYQEPNWETGRNVWWRMARADGAPWALAGLWSRWADPETGEIVPSYTLLTVNCDGHPLLGRLHKPDPALPPDAQDKRSLVPLARSQWTAWLTGTTREAAALLTPPPVEWFDPADALRTTALLRSRPSTPGAEPAQRSLLDGVG